MKTSLFEPQITCSSVVSALCPKTYCALQAMINFMTGLRIRVYTSDRIRIRVRHLRKPDPDPTENYSLHFFFLSIHKLIFFGVEKSNTKDVMGSIYIEPNFFCITSFLHTFKTISGYKEKPDPDP